MSLTDHKRRKKNETIRTPYYEMGDGLQKLLWVAQDKKLVENDPKVLELVKKIAEARDELHRHLCEHYLWD